MALDGDVRKTLLDRTDAEKVFRPWWDTIEDMLLNTLIGLGMNSVNIYLYLTNYFSTCTTIIKKFQFRTTACGIV